MEQQYPIFSGMLKAITQRIIPIWNDQKVNDSEKPTTSLSLYNALDYYYNLKSNDGLVQYAEAENSIIRDIQEPLQLYENLPKLCQLSYMSTNNGAKYTQSITITDLLGPTYGPKTKNTIKDEEETIFAIFCKFFYSKGEFNMFWKCAEHFLVYYIDQDWYRLNCSTTDDEYQGRVDSWKLGTNHLTEDCIPVSMSILLIINTKRDAPI